MKLQLIEDEEPELVTFYNQVNLLSMRLGHKPNHTTFDLQSGLPVISTGVMVIQNLWEWPTNNWSDWRPISLRRSTTDSSRMARNQKPDIPE